MSLRTTAFAAVALAAWLAPTTASASPINYTITISGGVKDCGVFRPLKQACDSVITASMLVDSEGATFADQLLALSLPVAPELTYTVADTRRASLNTLQFDASGTLIGFSLPLIVYRPDPNYPDPLTPYAVAMVVNAQGSSFAFEERGRSDSYNRCKGCVAISVSVPEPGASWLLIPAVALTLMGTRRRRTHLAG